MSRALSCTGVLLIAGAAVLCSAASASADDCPFFACFRRCPADSGCESNTLLTPARHLCRPPRCPPYCDPTFGFYPTSWRPWPTLYVSAPEEVLLPPAGKAAPAAPPGGTEHGPMPPASDEARRPRTPGNVAPTVQSPAPLPAFNGASAR